MQISTATLLSLTFLSTTTATAITLPAILPTTNTTQCYLFEGCGVAQVALSIADMWTLRSRICGDGPDSRWKKGGSLSLDHDSSGHLAINGACGDQALCLSTFENIINQCFDTAMLGLVVVEDMKCSYLAARCY